MDQINKSNKSNKQEPTLSKEQISKEKEILEMLNTPEGRQKLARRISGDLMTAWVRVNFGNNSKNFNSELKKNKTPSKKKNKHFCKMGYAIKDKNGKYYSSQHQNSVSSLKNADYFNLKDARKFLKEDGEWNYIVSVFISEGKCVK